MRRPDETEPHELQPGEYAKWRGMWFCCTPNGHAGNLSGHQIKLHDDGTITVSPSILISSPSEGELFHGYLINGVWSEC